MKRWRLSKKQKERYAKAIRLRFEDESRTIGSGVRPVVVLSVGPKWVRLQSAQSGVSTKVNKKAWERLVRRRPSSI